MFDLDLNLIYHDDFRHSMKPKFRKPVSTFSKICVYISLGSSVIIGDQINKFIKKLNKATSTDILSISRFQPNYIYIEDPFVQEEIAAGVSLNTNRLKLHRFHKWLYDKIEESFIFRNWFSYRKNLAWRFLSLAQDENQIYRARAISSLASLKNLTDADHQQLAQACDLRTAVALARSTDNDKFLLDPPYFKMKTNLKSIVKNFQEFFSALEIESKHTCLQQFVSKMLCDVAEASMEDNYTYSLDNKQFISMSLEALLHHSWTDENAKEIIRLGGLPLLTDVYKYLLEKEDLDSLIVLSKLVSNLSTCSEAAQAFFISGWLKLLSVLSQHMDIRVSAPAQKALCNFDKDDPCQKDTQYYRRVFPLHPTKRALAQPKLDVIFIHGLLGGVFITWRQRDYGHCTHKSPLELLGFTLSSDKGGPYQTNQPLDQDFFVDVEDLDNWESIAKSYEFVLADIPVDSNLNDYRLLFGDPTEIDCPTDGNTKCWPKDWLAKDCPEIRVLGVNYETNISRWAPLCPSSPKNNNLKDRSSQLLNVLSRAGVGRRPIVWVGHSMGGLIVKGVLNLSKNSSDPVTRSIYEQTKGIVFYSTPHKGSHLAALNLTSQMIVWPSIEVQELRQNSPCLLDLQHDFLELLKENSIKVVSFAERKSTYLTSLKFELRFVDADSAYPDVGESYGIPLDHLCICKPAGKQSFLYQRIKQFIRDTIRLVDAEKTF